MIQAAPSDINIEMLDNLLSVLRPDQKEYVRNSYSVSKYKRNQIIYKEGENPDGLMFLGKGGMIWQSS